jgi:hypothetical protein
VRLSICLITARTEPHYEWLIADLAAQARAGDELEIIAIDAFARPIGTLLPNVSRIEDSGAELCAVTIEAPMPNPYQGEHRVTTRDLHAIAYARNTALCLASLGSYVAFLDDRVRLGKRWLEIVRGAAARYEANGRGLGPGSSMGSSVVCGPCDRLTVNAMGGKVFDERRLISPRGRLNAGGNWLHGGNFALPLELALAVNGCEVGTDPLGRQDRVMGMMLGNLGHRIDFDIDMEVVIDRRLPVAHPFPRVRRGIPPADKGRAIIARFGARKRTELTPDLVAIRAMLGRGEPFPHHGISSTTRDWFDGQPIGKM